MRKIVVLSFISLDGVMQAPGGPEEDPSGDFSYGGWTVPYWDEFSNEVMGEQMSVPFDLLLGRKTYDIFAAYWPHQKPTALASTPFSRATKYVVSRSAPKLSWGKSVLIDGDVVKKLETLKQQNGSLLQVHGSGELVQTLFAHDLVDELWLKILPVTIGEGKRLFADGTMPAAFELIEIESSPSDVIFAKYKRSGVLTTDSFV